MLYEVAPVEALQLRVALAAPAAARMFLGAAGAGAASVSSWIAGKTFICFSHSILY